MKTTTTVSLASIALTLITPVIAIDTLDSRTTSGHHVLSLDFVKERRANANNVEIGRKRLKTRSLMRRSMSLEKRAKIVLESLDNAQQLYYANVSLGTPAQAVRLQIDTGSSDVWVNSANSNFCQGKVAGQPAPCNEGSFNEVLSSSFNTVDQGGFNISYVDGTSATGDYFTDNFQIGGITVSNQQMGLAKDTDIPAGIMGIGYDVNEASIQYVNQKPYSSLVDSLQTSGAINTKAYSLWLNDLDSNTGSVLFGGVDKKKYQGSLTGLPIQISAITKMISDFSVVLSSVSVTSASGQISNVQIDNVAVILDSGSTLMYLPDDTADAVAKAIGATYSSKAQEYFIGCTVGSNSGASVDVGFGGSGGPVIKVPYDELILPAVTESGAQVTDRNGNPVCSFGIQRAGDSSVLFGDTFLRSAYVVYDLSANAIYMSQTVFNVTDTEVTEIHATVPDVTYTATAVAAATNTKKPHGFFSHSDAHAITPSTDMKYILPIAITILSCILGGGALVL